jgi:hypothetical protein
VGGRRSTQCHGDTLKGAVDRRNIGSKLLAFVEKLLNVLRQRGWRTDIRHGYFPSNNPHRDNDTSGLCARLQLPEKIIISVSGLGSGSSVNLFSIGSKQATL